MVNRIKILNDHNKQMEDRAQLQPDRLRLNMTKVLKTLHKCSSKCAVFSVIDGYGSVIDDSLAISDLEMMSTSRNNCTTCMTQITLNYLQVSLIAKFQVLLTILR